LTGGGGGGGGEGGCPAAIALSSDYAFGQRSHPEP
jgi:hypothetical protein